MPFQGFSEETNRYFFGAELENTRAYFERNREVYQTYVKKPLLALHEELVAVAKEIDEDIVVAPNRCTSKAFNDFRYTGKVTPVKTYMYLHFFSRAENKAYDTPGVFFDAGSTGYRIGFGSYDMTPPAMEAVRRAILSRRQAFLNLEEQRVADGFELRGADYKRDHFPDEPEPLKTWLNKRSFYLVRECAHDEAYYSHALVDVLRDAFLRCKPIYWFMNRALQEQAAERPRGYTPV